MNKVYVKECNSYNKENLKKHFKEMFNLLDINIKNKKTLVKPNLLISKSPEFPSTTHPKFIEALLEFLISKKAKPIIYEIPGFDPVKTLIKKIGIEETCKKLKIEIKDKGESVISKNENNLIVRELPLPSELKEYDLIINLAKLKTHSLTGLTMGVKNTFGFVKQGQRINYHLKAGRNKELFSDIIIDIHLLVKPHLTILDGILGMEGNGPTNGKERKFNLLAASKNAFSLDSQIINLLKLDPSQVPIQKRAIERKINGAKIEETESIGDKVNIRYPILLPDSYIKRKNKVINKAINIGYPIFSPLMVSKPKIIKKRCISCFRCMRVCPAKTIHKGIDNKPEINYKNCISCFCCHEMCPVNAIEIEKSKLRKILEKVIWRKK